MSWSRKSPQYELVARHDVGYETPVCTEFPTMRATAPSAAANANRVAECLGRLYLIAALLFVLPGGHVH